MHAGDRAEMRIIRALIAERTERKRTNTPVDASCVKQTKDG